MICGPRWLSYVFITSARIMLLACKHTLYFQKYIWLMIHSFVKTNKQFWPMDEARCFFFCLIFWNFNLVFIFLISSFYFSVQTKFEVLLLCTNEVRIEEKCFLFKCVGLFHRNLPITSIWLVFMSIRVCFFKHWSGAFTAWDRNKLMRSIYSDRTLYDGHYPLL